MTDGILPARLLPHVRTLQNLHLQLAASTVCRHLEVPSATNLQQKQILTTGSVENILEIAGVTTQEADRGMRAGTLIGTTQARMTGITGLLASRKNNSVNGVGTTRGMLLRDMTDWNFLQTRLRIVLCRLVLVDL